MRTRHGVQKKVFAEVEVIGHVFVRKGVNLWLKRAFGVNVIECLVGV